MKKGLSDIVGLQNASLFVLKGNFLDILYQFQQRLCVAALLTQMFEHLVKDGTAVQRETPYRCSLCRILVQRLGHQGASKLFDLIFYFTVYQPAVTSLPQHQVFRKN